MMIKFSYANNTNNHHYLDFDYDPFSPNGPKHWKNVDTHGNEWEKFTNQDHIDLDIDGNECGSKRRPSPIHLFHTNDKCRDNHEILTRKIRSTDCQFRHLTFKISPHGLRASFPSDDSMCLRPTIDLPNGYPYRWHAHHIEVHLRSEHVLDGRRFDGEMEMVHLGQVDQHRELAVVSVLLDASGLEDNAKLQQYIDEWQALAHQIEEMCKNHPQRRLKKTGNKPNISKKQQRASHSYAPNSSSSKQFWNQTKNNDIRIAVDDPEHNMGHDARFLKQNENEKTTASALFPRRKMFPYDIWPTIYFYRYKGSMTMPPCSEIVSWRVLDEPLIISKRQWKQLAQLIEERLDETSCENKTASNSMTGETFRPLQSHNEDDQTLTHCTEENYSFWLYPPHQT